jgi:transcriptional regulator with GAF, ATPase, and Fis domain
VGESGTGKELVARELHRLGPGPRKSFVAVNCAALPDNLVESELFGHERGAFTGANRTHRGAFEAAGGGTLFLDEIGDLPAAAQAKLLRVLEERTVTRIGGERTITVDARVVAATHRDLTGDVDAGRFRQDLFYRLNVHILTVPPLRDRRSDIPDIATHLLTGICDRFGIRAKTIAPEAMDVLMAAEFKRNNVRELRNVIERMVLATDADTITAADVPADIRDDADRTGNKSAGDTLQAQKAEAERRIIVAALERHDWHITNTAQSLGLADHASLLKIMRRHGLKRR